MKESTIGSLLAIANKRDEKFDATKYKDLSTVVVIPNRGVIEEESFLNCEKCKHKNKYKKVISNGFHPLFFTSYKNHLIKPMNVPVVEMVIPGMEVGSAYSTALEHILSHPVLSKYKYMLTVEDDNIIPPPDEKLPRGALWALYEDTEEKGYDVAAGLYFTKGIINEPLLYGDPKELNRAKEGMFKVRYDWKDKPEGPIECNGMGMGFTLFKLDIFRDKRMKQPYFKTVSGIHGKGKKRGIGSYTQDLYAFENIRKLGYKVAVDTRVKIGHLDTSSGEIF